MEEPQVARVRRTIPQIEADLRQAGYNVTREWIPWKNCFQWVCGTCGEEFVSHRDASHPRHACVNHPIDPGLGDGHGRDHSGPANDHDSMSHDGAHSSQRAPSPPGGWPQPDLEGNVQPQHHADDLPLDVADILELPAAGNAIANAIFEVCSAGDVRQHSVYWQVTSCGFVCHAAYACVSCRLMLGLQD